jgi:hypothetical protein
MDKYLKRTIKVTFYVLSLAGTTALTFLGFGGTRYTYTPPLEVPVAHADAVATPPGGDGGSCDSSSSCD